MRGNTSDKSRVLPPKVCLPFAHALGLDFAEGRTVYLQKTPETSKRQSKTKSKFEVLAYIGVYRIMTPNLFVVQVVIAAASLVAEYQCGELGPGVAPQICGPNNVNFYCPVDQRCKPRVRRCTNATVCGSPAAGKDDGCFETSINGSYTVLEGHAKVGLLGFKRTFLEHRFIQYRGFTYEFGASYGLQILDINDPNYKYKEVGTLNKNGIRTVGESYCTWQDATKVARMWENKKYNLFTNNCKHFSDILKSFLTSSMCATPPSRIQDRANRVEQDINGILTKL